MNKFVQGKFRPEFPEKYIGDVNKITFRSSWERIVMNFLDQQPTIIRWQSEEQQIPYRSPVDGRMHRYILDFSFWSNTPDGIKKFMVEVKPKKQVLKPSKTGSESDASFQERIKEWLINDAKWKAARIVAERDGSQFVILTEEQIMPSQNSIKAYQHPKKAKKNVSTVKSRTSKKPT